MKEKSHVLILLSWVHTMLLFEGIYVLAAAIRNVREHELNRFLFQGLFMLFPVVLSYIAVCRCRNLWMFLVLSLAAVWGMKTVSGSILTGGLTAFVFLFRCHVKLKQGEIRRKMKELPGESGVDETKELWELPTLLDAPRIPHCLLFVAMYLGILYFHRYALLNLMLGILAAELCVCLAYRYLEGLEGFIKNNVYIANLPAGTMKKIGTGILFVGITMLMLFMLPAAIYHEEPLSKLRFDLENTGNWRPEYYEEHAETNDMMEELMNLKAQAKEPPEWLKKVSEIISFLILVGISCLALKMVFMAVRNAVESFSDDSGDEIISLEKENDSKEGKKRLLKKTEKEHFRSPDRKIRRLYKKLIRQSLKERPYGNETPLELENKAGLYENRKEETGRIHELYEKARYGKEECTKEEARQCMNIFFKM